MAKWKQTRCWHCGGHGVGMTGDGPVWECNICGGSGGIWVSEKDRVALWPGGPFQGSFPGEYQRCVEMTGTDNDWTPPPSDEKIFGWMAEEIFILENTLKEIVNYPHDDACAWCMYKAEEGLAKAKAVQENNERTV